METKSLLSDCKGALQNLIDDTTLTLWGWEGIRVTKLAWPRLQWEYDWQTRVTWLQLLPVLIKVDDWHQFLQGKGEKERVSEVVGSSDTPVGITQNKWLLVSEFKIFFRCLCDSNSFLHTLFARGKI